MGLAVLNGLNPLRLGVALLLISRPRPVQNLIFYWVGSLIEGVAVLLIPLIVLHLTPMHESFEQDWATSSAFRHIQIGMGVLLILIAALMTVRFATRPRAYLPTSGGNTSVAGPDSDAPTTISPLQGPDRDTAPEVESVIQRLVGRARNAWDNGSLWVALVLGIGTGGLPFDGALVILAVIVTSGAAIGTQFSAAIAFIIVMLAVVEIILVSYLAASAKTHAVLRRLHDWAWAHRRKVLVAMFAVIGISLVANGMGGA